MFSTVLYGLIIPRKAAEGLCGTHKLARAESYFLSLRIV